MLKFELIKNVLIVGIGAGIITTALVQKIKEGLKTKKYIVLISFIVSMIIGTLFAKYFSDLSIVYCLWAGLFSFIGADILFKTFEDKIFTPFSKMQKTVEVPADNKIEAK